MQKILIFLFFFSTCSFVQAQFSFGISIGGNMANWPGDDEVIINNSDRLNLDELIANGTAEVLSVNNKSRWGGTYGLIAEYKINDQWCIEPGIYYSPQGDKIEGDATVTVTNPQTQEERVNSVRYEAISETDYIILPIRVRYGLDNGLNFHLGPQVGYRLNGTAKTEGYFKEDNLTLPFERDISDRLKSIDFGAVGGLSYQFINGFGITAEHALAANQLPKEDRKVHNSVTSLKISYFIF